ncbi:MAG: hypothetical protein AB1298_04205 [Bacteroidota bacterium]
MKSLLFTSAILNRNRVKFLYGFEEVNLEPYYIGRNKNGKKVLYGKINSSNEIKMFEYDKMCNIKVLCFDKFSPVIPIIPSFN